MKSASIGTRFRIKQLHCLVPNVFELRDTITGFKGTLCISEDKAREIEQGTREQRNSSLWHSVRRYQITSSLFGAVLAGRETTPPDSLV